MKNLFILIFIAVLTGCSGSNGFTKFSLTPEQERTEASLQSAKIINNNGSLEGVMHAVYLNQVYPKKFHGYEYFYIYFYKKEKRDIYDPVKIEDPLLSFTLNSKLPIKIKELSHANAFSHLSNADQEWNRYFLVAFKEQGSRLTLLLKSDKVTSNPLIYQKDRR